MYEVCRTRKREKGELMTGQISTYLPFVLLEVFDDVRKVDEKLFETVEDAVNYAKENGIELN